MDFILIAIALVGFCLPATTTAHATDATDVASALLDAMIKRDGAAAKALYARRESRFSDLDDQKISERVSQINEGRFEKATAKIVGSESRGDFCIVEVDWLYKGHQVWDAMYLTKRDGRWVVFPSDAPPVIDHMIARAEQRDFRGLVDAFEAKRAKKLRDAVPLIPGAADPLEAAARFQAAVNAADEDAIRKMCLQTTMSLVDGTEHRIAEMQRGEYEKGDLVVEAHKSAETICVVIMRSRGEAGLSRRHELHFIRRGATWYLMPASYGGNHSYREFRDVMSVGNWALNWSLRPALRGDAPTPELALAWATEELPQAAAGGKPERVGVLLDRGADPNAQEDGMTALIHAVRNDQAEVVKLLLDRGANPQIRDVGWGQDAFAHSAKRLAEEPESERARRIKALLDESRARK